MPRSEPEHLVDAEVVAEDSLELLAADAGVALLDLAEQAFFGGEQDPCAVDVDGAAFEHEAALLAVRHRLVGCHSRQTAAARRRGRDLVVEVPVGILGPGVEAPVGDGDLALAALRTKIGPESRVQTRSVGHW